jgi:hypothetical protein
MPATSAKQKKFMDAAAHNPAFAKKAGIPVGVAKEFSEESKGAKLAQQVRPDRQTINQPKTDHGKSALFSKGGAMKSDMKEDMAMDKAQDKSMIKKAIGQHDTQLHGGKKTTLKLKSGGSASSRADGCAVRGKTRGKMV